MKTINFKSQSAEAVNSAVAKIFANVSVNEVAQKFTKKLIKTKNAQGLKGLSASMEIRVSDDFRVKVDAGVFDYGRYIVNVVIEEKFGNRFMEFGRQHYDGENINLISFSQIFADVEAAMYEIVDDYLYLIEHWVIKNNELDLQHNYNVRTWEELTGLDFAEVVMGVEPMPESAEATEEDVINEVVGIINANLIDDATEGQKLDWSLFNDSTMEYLFANGGPELYGKIIARVTQISDCLAYDDCFYVWYEDVPAKNDAPCLDATENVRDYLNNDERAFFVLPDYDYVCGLFIEYNEDDDVYVAMGNESWNATEYDGDTDMSVVIADFSNAWAKEIDEYCDFYKGLDYDRKIYRNDDYDAYMILLNSGVSQGLNVEEGYDPYKGDYVEVIA